MAVSLAALGSLAVFAATLGAVIVSGSLPGWLGGGSSLPQALALFLAGSAAVTLVVWLAAAVRTATARRA